MYLKMDEFEDNESKVSMPIYKRKKIVIITGRVHPGESNSSFMMEGLIRYLLGNSMQAKQLRKRIVFKIIPMINVDGVVAGNYRASFSGNDLNRNFKNQDLRVHPEVQAIKDLLKDIIGKKKEEQGAIVDEDDILAYIDMHGHSRKKCVFVYGNQFPLSSDKYYRTRLLPKLISEETQMFRYHSS